MKFLKRMIEEEVRRQLEPLEDKINKWIEHFDAKNEQHRAEVMEFNRTHHEQVESYLDGFNTLLEKLK